MRGYAKQKMPHARPRTIAQNQGDYKRLRHRALSTTLTEAIRKKIVRNTLTTLRLSTTRHLSTAPLVHQPPNPLLHHPNAPNVFANACVEYCIYSCLCRYYVVRLPLSYACLCPIFVSVSVSCLPPSYSVVSLPLSYARLCPAVVSLSLPLPLRLPLSYECFCPTVSLSLSPVATTETRTAPSRLESYVDPKMILAVSSSTSSVTRVAASSTSNKVMSAPPVIFTNTPFADCAKTKTAATVEDSYPRQRIPLVTKGHPGGIRRAGFLGARAASRQRMMPATR